MATRVIPSDYSDKNYVSIEAESIDDLTDKINELTAGASPLWQFDGAFFVNSNAHYFAILRRLNPVQSLL